MATTTNGKSRFTPGAKTTKKTYVVKPHGRTLLGPKYAVIRVVTNTLGYKSETVLSTFAKKADATAYAAKLRKSGK